MAQWLKFLLWEHEDLSWDSQQPCKMPNPPGGTYNPSAGEVEREEYWGLDDQPVEPINKRQVQ